MKDFIPFIVMAIAGSSVYYFLKRNKRFSPFKKSTLIIAVVAFIITEAGRSFYRPFIYANNINDYMVADMIGNSFGTMTAIFFILTVSGRETKKDFALILLITLGLVLYESMNLVFGYPFNSNDIIATVSFGLLSVLIYRILLKRKDRSTESNWAKR